MGALLTIAPVTFSLMIWRETENVMLVFAVQSLGQGMAQSSTAKAGHLKLRIRPSCLHPDSGRDSDGAMMRRPLGVPVRVMNRKVS